MSLTLGQNFSIWEPLVPNVEQCETSFNNPVGSKNFSKFFQTLYTFLAEEDYRTLNQST